MAKKNTNKIPKFGAEPNPAKKPVFTEPVYNDGHPLAWRLCMADKGGPFPWTAITPDKLHEIFGKLAEFEPMNWEEIKRGGSHPIQVASLCMEARERLVQLKLDDFDELVSLRLTGKNRVWCIQTGHLMRLLWWDADHKVYPVEKDKDDRRKRKNRR